MSKHLAPKQKKQGFQKTIAKSGEITEGISKFFNSRQEGLSSIVKKDSFAEKTDFTMTEVIASAAMILIGIILMVLKIKGIVVFLLSLLECVFLLRKLALPVWNHLKALSFFHAGVILLVCVIGGLTIANPQNAVIIAACYVISEYFREVVGLETDETDKDDEPEDIAEVWTRGNGRIVRAPIESVQAGDYVYIDVNSEVPLDGVIVAGTSKVDRHKLSRIILQKAVGEGDFVYAGDENLSGQLCIQVTRTRSDSRIFEAERIMKECEAEKSDSEKRNERLSEIFSRILVFAGLIAIILSAFFKSARTAMQTSGICLLLFSCTGLDFLEVLYARVFNEMRKLGIVVTDKAVFDNIADADTVAFDKTGIITDNKLTLIDIQGNGTTKDQVLKYAASAERYSRHPIAKFLKGTCPELFADDVIKPVEERQGYGIGAFVDGHLVYVGNEKLMNEHGINVMISKKPGLVCHVSKDNEYMGYLLLGENINDSAYEFTETLNSMNLGQLVMMTGSSVSSSKQVVKDLSVNLMKCELTPEDKCRTMEFLDDTKKGDSQLVYLNRGANVFDIAAKADISVSVAGLEEDAELSSSDIYLFNNDISVLPGIISLSRSARAVAKQDMTWIIAANAAILIVCAFGFIPTGICAIAHFGMTALAYINLRRVKR